LSDVKLHYPPNPSLRLISQVASTVLPPIAEVLVALGLSALLLALTGYHAADVLNVMALGAFVDKRVIAEAFAKAAPLILIGGWPLRRIPMQHLEHRRGRPALRGAIGATACGLSFSLPPSGCISRWLPALSPAPYGRPSRGFCPSISAPTTLRSTAQATS
jgi:hypothetical protein